MTYETLFKNIEKMTKEYGEDISKSLKDVLTTLKAEGKTADEAVNWIGDKLKGDEVIMFSKDESALMRLLIKYDLPWIARDEDENLWVFEDKPERSKNYFMATGDYGHLPDVLFPQITWDNSPIDCKAYLESESKN